MHTYPEISLAKAREKVLELRSAKQQGIDPDVVLGKMRKSRYDFDKEHGFLSDIKSVVALKEIDMRIDKLQSIAESV